MRGRRPRHDDDVQLLSRRKQRVRADHPLRADSPDDRRGAGATVAAIRPAVFDDRVGRRFRPSSCCARCCCRLLYSDSQRAAADGAARLQPAVPVVRRPESGRCRSGTPTMFTKNRDRLLDGDVADAFFAEVLRRDQAPDGLLSDEHFTVDGTLLEAWASQKSFQPKDGGRDGRPMIRRIRREFPRADAAERHASVDDRSRRAAVSRKRSAAKRTGVSRASADRESPRARSSTRAVTAASGTAERDAAIVMLGELPRRRVASPSAPTRGTTRARWVAAVATDGHHAACGAERTRTAAARSTGGRRVMWATRSVIASANSSNKPSAG